jgi:hypothetical protein
MRRFILPLVLLGLLLLPRVGRAESAPPSAVVVVAVAVDGPELDAAQLRAAIGRELHRDVVGQDDPRAASACGRIDVTIDRSAHKLVVSYRGGAEPLVRLVDLPTDRDATTRVVALLAGNLGRDEADELAASLRREAPPPSARPSVDDRELVANDRLRGLLVGYARQDRAIRHAWGWSLVGGAIAAGGVSIYLRLRGGEATQVAPQFEGMAVALGLYGGLYVAIPSAFEKMSEEYDFPAVDARSTGLREQLENRWKLEAGKAHSRRVGLGLAALILGAAAGALDVWLFSQEPRSTATTISGVADAAATAGVIGAGVVLLTTESHVESRLHQYERGLDHPIELSDVGLRLAPAPGGVEAAISGRF